LAGHYKKSSISPGNGLWEFKVESEDLENLEVGSQLDIDIFEEGQKIDVQGKSKGKDLQVLSKDGILRCKMPLTETLYLTELLDQSVNVKLLEKYGREKKCQVTWAMKRKLSKILKLLQ
jgi:hypothetical protein